MLSSCTELLKNWILFSQVTVSLCYQRVEGLRKMVSKHVFENVHSLIHTSSSYPSMCGHLKHFSKKLRKSSEIMGTEAEANRNP